MLTEILIAIAVALAGGLLYTIVGIIPGTDETATMVPITIILVLAGLPAGALFAWEIGIIVAMQVSHTSPTAMSALPGSTMAVPMVLNCSIAKRLGVPHMAMRKMASGSIVGTCFALPLAIIVALILSPLGSIIASYSGVIFTLCALLIAWMSSAKWGAVACIIPFAIFIQALQRIAIEGHGSTVFTSIFMGITIGPMIYELFGALIPSRRKQFAKDEPNLAGSRLQAEAGILPQPLPAADQEADRPVRHLDCCQLCWLHHEPRWHDRSLRRGLCRPLQGTV